MIEFTIPGPPVAKGRPRFASGKRGVIAFTPQKTKRYETLVKATAMEAMHRHGSAQFSGPVKVTISALFGHKTKQGWHTSRPDLDNIIKAVLDGLNEVVYADDAAVCCVVASKQYCDSGNEQVQVKVEHV